MSNRQPFTIHFETPAGDPVRWCQFHESAEAASEALRAAVSREYDGKARIRALRRGRDEARRLECCVCGDDAGVFHQHWNRDDGYGVCAKCVGWLRGRGYSEEKIRDYYGIEGVNFAATEPIFHMTVDAVTTLCGRPAAGVAIHAHYGDRELDRGRWCSECQAATA